MQAFKFAQTIISTLSLDPLLPGYSAITFALADKTRGLLGGYVNSAGQFVVPTGLVSQASPTSAAGPVSAPKGVASTLANGDGVNPTIVAAAGTNQGGAAALGAQGTQLISSASSNAGVILASSASLPLGATISLFNTSATAAKLYPDSGGMLNFAATNASQVIPASTGIRAKLIAPAQTLTGGTTQTSTTVAVASSTGLFVGESVSGPGIASGATISTIPSTTQITLSANSTATNSHTTLTLGSAWMIEEMGTLG